MKVGMSVVGSIEEAMREIGREGERAVSRSMKTAGNGLKDDWRAQIIGAGLGTRLSRTVRAEIYPKGQNSMNAAAFVYTRAPKVLQAFDRGALIRSKNGFFLAIPTPAAGSQGAGRKRITPGGWERRTGLKLRLIYRRSQPSLLVAEGRVSKSGRAVASRSKTGRGLQTVPIFILVPQVNLRKRLDLARDAESRADSIPALIVSNWKEGA